MELINPHLDVVFKLLLLADPRLLRSMIESVLHLSEPLADVTVLNPELPSHAPEDHGVVVDVRVRLASGEEIDIEMATRANSDLPPRLLFYWARHFSTQLPRGAAYRELLPLRLIVWTLRTIVPAAPPFHEVFDIVGRSSRATLAPHFELHVLDLSRLPPSGDDDDARAHRWGRFLLLQDEAEATLLAKEDPIMTIAVEELLKLSSDPVVRRMADDRERDLIGHGHLMAVALKRERAEGKEEGLAIGKEEGLAAGKEEGLAIGKEEGLATATREAIEAVADILGIELTAARRAELATASTEALHERLASLRRSRAWR